MSSVINCFHRTDFPIAPNKIGQQFKSHDLGGQLIFLEIIRPSNYSFNPL